MILHSMEKHVKSMDNREAFQHLFLCLYAILEMRIHMRQISKMVELVKTLQQFGSSFKLCE